MFAYVLGAKSISTCHSLYKTCFRGRTWPPSPLKPWDPIPTIVSVLWLFVDRGRVWVVNLSQPNKCWRSRGTICQGRSGWRRQHRRWPGWRRRRRRRWQRWRTSMIALKDDSTCHSYRLNLPKQTDNRTSRNVSYANPGVWFRRKCVQMKF